MEDIEKVEVTSHIQWQCPDSTDTKPSKYRLVISCEGSESACERIRDILMKTGNEKVK